MKPTWKSSDEATQCQPRTLDDDEIASRYFIHEHKLLDGSLKPNLGQIVVIAQHDDGYCTCKTLHIKGNAPVGLSAKNLTLFSGCLSPAQPMPPEVAKLARELRNALA